MRLHLPVFLVLFLDGSKNMNNCYPKYAHCIFYIFSGILIFFSVGPWIINTDDLLFVKISWTIIMSIFSILLFFAALWFQQFYIIENGYIICKNCFGKIQEISIENALCIIQELPTYFNWMASINKKWICIYCKDSAFRFKSGCSNSRKKRGIQIIYSDKNYELIRVLFQI